MMKVVVPFIDGPLHGIKFQMEWIPQLNWFTDEKNRRIHAYLREEMAYWYDKELSDKMTKVYDQIRNKLPGRTNKMIPME